MFKPRLRIPRGSGLRKPSHLQPCPSQQLSSPFVVAAKHNHHQQKRSIHATPARCLHTLPSLNDGGKFSEEGIKDLYTPHGFNAAYNMYQTWCLDRLNELTQGTTLDGPDHDPKTTAILTSREPSQADIFNYASMAHNNHFFFDGLAVNRGADGAPDPAEQMPPGLAADLATSFGSLETLQRELLLTADAMFGPGFVWLVRQTDISGGQRHPFRILTTYHAGSPYPAAHWRLQFADLNHQAGVTDTSGAVVRGWLNSQNRAQGRSPLHGPAPGTQAILGDPKNRPPGSAELVPVLCVNTWEFAWLFDWGIGGRWNYLARWWECINWGKVAERANAVGGYKMSANAPLMGRAAADSDG